MLDEDLNDTQLVESASAITSDLGQLERQSDREAQRCRTRLVAAVALIRTKTVTVTYKGEKKTLLCDVECTQRINLHLIPYFCQVSSALLEGHRNSLRCRALLRVIGCHEDEYFVRPILIKIDNCAELSSGDDSRVEFITEAPDRGPRRAFLMICSMAL